MHSMFKLALVAFTVSLGGAACAVDTGQDSETTEEVESTSAASAALKANSYTCAPNGACDCKGVADCIDMINGSCGRGTFCWDNAGTLRCSCWMN